MSMQSDLSRVRHLGSAKDGTHHWWGQRLTAIALVPLGLWFVYAVVIMTGKDLTAFKAWLSLPYNTLLMVLFIGALFHHLQLGLQVVVEDYVHTEKTKVVTLILNKFGAYLLAATCILSVLKVAFGG